MVQEYNKIAIFIPSLTIGGAEKQAFHYAKNIQRLNLGEVIIIGMGKEGALTHMLDKNDINYKSINISKLAHECKWIKLLGVIKLYNDLNKEKIKIAISFTYWPNVYIGMIYRVLGIKRFYWNQRSIDNLLPISFFEKIAIKNKPFYLANSIACKHFIEERHSVINYEKKAKIIRNYITDRTCPKRKNSAFRMVKVANFFFEKDYDTLLLATKELTLNHSKDKIELFIVGESPGISPEKYRIKALAFDLQLHSVVQFLSHDTDIFELLSSCDLGILSSRSEGCSNSLIEYMSAGLAVAASDIPANREILEYSDLNQLFEVGNVKALVDIMEESMDTTITIKRGELNKCCIKTMFSTHQFEKDLLEIINYKR